MKLSTAILSLNEKFFVMQDDLYSWFTSDENGTIEEFVSGQSETLHSLYIVENGDVSFLLVGVNGKVTRLYPGFEPSEENVYIEEVSASTPLVNRVVSVSNRNEIIRCLPARSDYEFDCLDDDFNTDVNEVFLSEVDTAFSDLISGVYSSLDSNELDGVPKDIFDKKLIDNLAEKIFPYFHMIDFGEEAKEYGSVKAACENFLQDATPYLVEYGVSKTINDIHDMDEDPDFELSDMIDSLMEGVTDNSYEAYVMACALVMVCDGEPDEEELLAFTKIALKAQLMINLQESLAEASNGGATENLGAAADTSDDSDALLSVLKEYNKEAVQEIISKVTKAWGFFQDNNIESVFIDRVADKIGKELSTFVLSTCIDTASSDHHLHEDERFVLAQLAVKWELETLVCESFHSMTGRSCTIESVDGRKMIVLSDESSAEVNDESLSDFWQAIMQEDTEKAIELIESGERIDDAIDVNDSLRALTPMMIVAEQFDTTLCQALIDACADINAKAAGDADGSVPLTWALKGDNLDNFRLLLSARANPDPLDSGEGKFSPLSMAAKHGLDEAVEELIALKVNVNWLNDSGQTALREAVNSGHEKCVSLLLNAGAKADTYDDEGYSPIHNAASSGYGDILKELLNSGVDINLPLISPAEDEGENILDIACYAGDIAIIKFLIESDAEVNDIKPIHNIVLGAIGRSEDGFELSSLLLEHGAKVLSETIFIAEAALPVHTFEMLFNRMVNREVPLKTEQIDVMKSHLISTLDLIDDDERYGQVIDVINRAGNAWAITVDA